ncbi:transport protein TonB [compost metagenome]
MGLVSVNNTNNDSMKLAGFTLILFLSVFTFGQSARKVNARLQAELTKEQQKQDSVRQVFSQSYNQLEKTQHQLGKQKERFITESSNTLFYRDSISRARYSLKLLGQAPDMNDVTTYMEMSNGWYFLQSVLSMKKKPEQFGTVSDSLNLDGLELKQQNERLETRLAEFRDLAKLNQLRMNQNEYGIKQAELGIHLLDSAALVYENATRVLLSKKRSLDSQLNVLRENYRLKGPAGFPDAYRTVFPDVHPVPRELVQEDAPDHRGFWSNEGAVDSPAPVESERIAVQEPEIYAVTDEQAEFPGGIAALKKYMMNNLQYPARANEMELQGKVYLQFIVSKEGEISNVKLLRGLPDCKECDLEAIRLVKAMPKWKPGKNNGKPVNSYFNLPVEFRLN